MWRWKRNYFNSATIISYNSFHHPVVINSVNEEDSSHLLKLALLTVMSWYAKRVSKPGSYSSHVTLSVSLIFLPFFIMKNFTNRKVERLVQWTCLYSIYIFNNCSHFTTASLSFHTQTHTHTLYTYIFTTKHLLFCWIIWK